MAYVIKGFVQMSDLISNTRGVVSGLGEISDQNLTQSREKQYFASGVYELIVMHSKLEGVHQEITPVTGASILEVMKWCRDFDYTKTNMADLFNTRFPDYGDVQFGPIVRATTGLDVTMVSWVSFNMALTSNTAEVKFWFNDTLFTTGYGEYECVVIPPTTILTDLYADYEDVQEAVNKENYVSLVSRVNSIVTLHPQTDLGTVELRWIQPSEPSKTFITVWTVVCYGEEGSRYDNMLTAIREHLEANSEYTLAQWREYLPDIQFAKIYHFIPMWGRSAISTGASSQNMYSPVIRVGEMITHAVPFMPSTSESEVREYGEFFPILHKAIGIICVGASGNDDGEKMFTDRYPDYTLIDINDQNIDNIAASTVQAIRQVELLARYAEIDDGVISLPSTLTRATVSGISYIELTESGTIFRMVTKQTYKDLEGTIDTSSTVNIG